MSKKQLLSISVLIFLSLFLTTATDKFRTQNEKTTYAQNPLYYLRSETSPNGMYRIDSFSGDYSDRYNYYQIFVINLKTDETKRLYSSDFRTTDWMWTADNKVKVVYNCGTGCRASKIIGVNEHIAIADYEKGGMNEKNGWNVEFFKSF